MDDDKLKWPETTCCWPGYQGGCVCAPCERALRGWMHNHDLLPPMTVEQREYCLAEIGRIEGWNRDDHEGDTDSELASATISAWTDYCRDKGLL